MLQSDLFLTIFSRSSHEFQPFVLATLVL